MQGIYTSRTAAGRTERLFIQQSKIGFYNLFRFRRTHTSHRNQRDCKFYKKNYPKYKIALLTNSTLFFQPDIRKRITGVDLIIASLDAASEENFKKINRPHPELELHRVIEGLVSLRKEFAKQLWMEVFLVLGINDNRDELNRIKKTLSLIYPDKIQLNTLDRPGAESWVKPVSQKDLLDVASYLNGVDVIKDLDSSPNNGVLNKNNCNYLLSIIKRRPCTAEDISRISDSNLEEIYRHLDALVEKGLIIKKICQEVSSLARLSHLKKTYQYSMGYGYRHYRHPSSFV